MKSFWDTQYDSKINPCLICWPFFGYKSEKRRKQEKDDYVPTPENIETTVVEGKHTSPLEQPERVMEMIAKLIGE